MTSASGKTSSLVSSEVLEGSGSGASTGADVSAGFSDCLSDVSKISIFSGEDDGTLGLLGSSMRCSSSLPFLSSAFVAFLQEAFDRVDLGSGAAFGAAGSTASTSVTLTVTVTGGLTCGNRSVRDTRRRSCPSFEGEFFKQHEGPKGIHISKDLSKGIGFLGGHILR